MSTAAVAAAVAAAVVYVKQCRSSGGGSDRNLITRCRRAEERLKVSRPNAEWRGAGWCGGVEEGYIRPPSPRADEATSPAVCVRRSVQCSSILHVFFSTSSL